MTNEVGRRIDALGLYFSGGASNADPSASLGGAISSTRVRGLGPFVSSPVPAVRIDHPFPGLGLGDATLTVDANGDLILTPPGGGPGTPLTIAAGESKILYAADTDEAMRITREAGLDFAGTGTVSLKKVFNGALAHDNVTDAQRAAGVTTYRGIILYAQGAFGVLNIRLWLPPIAGGQASWAIGTEAAPGGVIQTIVDEFTAPAVVAFSSPTTEGGALLINSISAGDYLGLWIRRTIPPASVVDVEEDFDLAMKYLGA